MASQYDFRWSPERFERWRIESGFRASEGTAFDHQRLFSSPTNASKGQQAFHLHQRRAAAVAVPPPRVSAGQPALRRPKSASALLRPMRDEADLPDIKPQPPLSYNLSYSSLGTHACLQRGEV